MCVFVYDMCVCVYEMIMIMRILLAAVVSLWSSTSPTHLYKTPYRRPSMLPPQLQSLADIEFMGPRQLERRYIARCIGSEPREL